MFLHYLKALRPSFSTFFLNSTAHFQHAHWRNMDPTPFKLKPTDADQAEYQHAVRYGYEEMDRIVADILAAAPRDTVVILATALSQQPCPIIARLFHAPWTGNFPFAFPSRPPTTLILSSTLLSFTDYSTITSRHARSSGHRLPVSDYCAIQLPANNKIA